MAKKKGKKEAKVTINKAKSQADQKKATKKEKAKPILKDFHIDPSHLSPKKQWQNFLSAPKTTIDWFTSSKSRSFYLYGMVVSIFLAGLLMLACYLYYLLAVPQTLLAKLPAKQTIIAAEFRQPIPPFLSELLSVEEAQIEHGVVGLLNVNGKAVRFLATNQSTTPENLDLTLVNFRGINLYVPEDLDTAFLAEAKVPVLANSAQFKEANHNLPELDTNLRLYMDPTLVITEAVADSPNLSAWYQVAAPFVSGFGDTVFVGQGQELIGYVSQEYQERPFLPGENSYRAELLQYLPAEPQLVIGGQGLAARILALGEWQSGKESLENLFGNITSGLNLPAGSYAALLNILNDELVVAQYPSPDDRNENNGLAMIANLDANEYQEFSQIALALHNYGNPSQESYELQDGSQGQVLVPGELAELPTLSVQLGEEAGEIAVPYLQLVQLNGDQNLDAKRWYLYYLEAEERLVITDSLVLLLNAEQVRIGAESSFADADIYEEQITDQLGYADELTYLSPDTFAKLWPISLPLIDTGENVLLIWKTYFLDGLQVRFLIE